MISIGDSDWDESDDELVVTKPLTNGHSDGHSADNQYVAEEDTRIQTQDFFTWEDLQAATVSGNLELVKNVLDTGELDVNAPLTSGWTLLMYAVEQGNPQLVAYYLSIGADVNYHCQMFYPVMACFNKPHIPPENVYECVKLLVEKEVLVNVHDKYHMSPLMLCARHTYTDALELLCQNNVDINKQDQRGWTSLMHAADQNQRSSIEILLKYRASIYIQSFDCQLTCADIAYNCGHQELYEFLEKIISPETDIFKPTLPKEDADKENEAPKYHKMRELELFLTSQELGNLIPLFNEQKVTFDMLLTMNQKDLERLGISQIGVQQKLLTAIKGVHGSEYEMPDMSQSLYNLELNCRDCSKVMKIYSKHVKYLRATSEYLLRQCRYSKKLEAEYPTNAPEDSGLLNNFQNVYEIARGLNENIESINDVLSKKLNIKVSENRSKDIVRSGVGLNFVFGVVFGVGIGALTCFTVLKKLHLLNFKI